MIAVGDVGDRLALVAALRAVVVGHRGDGLAVIVRRPSGGGPGRKAGDARGCGPASVVAATGGPGRGRRRGRAWQGDPDVADDGGGAVLGRSRQPAGGL